MKKTLISVTLLATMSLSPSAFSAPVAGSLTLQWAGNVPAAAEHGEGFFIIKDGPTDFHDGKLTFKNNEKIVTLTGSTEMGFKIVKDAVVDAGAYDPTADVAPLAYTATLTNLKVGVNALIGEEDPVTGNFVIHANGKPMAINTPTTQSPDVTRLKVVQNEAAGVNKERFKSGDSIDVHALISVTADVV